MPDMLATAEDLAHALQRDPGSIDTDTANLVLAASTAAVQTAAGNQRLVEVVDDTLIQMGNLGYWLVLPQRPVTDIESVILDGVELEFGTDMKWVPGADRIWRRCGWQAVRYEPSIAEIVYSHGWATGAQDLELAKGSTLTISKALFINPDGVASEKIDDYAVSFAKASEEASAQLDASPFLGRALRSKYGTKASVVTIGSA